MAQAVSSLIPLGGVDPQMVEDLLDRAFGPGRFARTAYKVREGTETLPALSLAALDESELLVGTIQAWPVALTDPDGRVHPMIMVGPVAVLPERQGEGFGTALMLAQQQAIGDGPATLPQMLIGDVPYYSRFGFSADHTQGWSLPGPYEKDRLLVRCQNPAILPREGMLGPWRG
jgi:predicted N-acetyltransferase YhbS